MSAGLGESRRLPLVPALLAVIVAQFILLALLIFQQPSPGINTAFDGASVAISADRAWTTAPGQCATVSWALEGIASVYVNGAGKVGQDKMEFCPTPGERNLVFAIRAAAGDSRDITLAIHPDLPSALASWLALTALLLPLFMAGYYLATMRLTQPSAKGPSALLALVALLLCVLLWQAARPATVSSVLDQMEGAFTSRSWHLLGSVLAGLIFLPLGLQALRRSRQRSGKGDLVATVAFFFVVIILVSPVGFDSIGQWETWQFQAYFEGRASRAGAELISRFWLLVPGALASAISPDSFAGFHIVNRLMFWGMMLFFYAILRQLRLPAWLAFLAAVLFLVYPANSGLMSLRSIFMTFGKLSLLAAVYLVLECRGKPSRARLLGIWLMLLLNLGSQEHGLVIILIVPLLWWRRSERFWPSFNLALIWYLAPVAKAAHIALVFFGGRNFYGLRFTAGSSTSDYISLERAGHYLDVAANVYRQTFLVGWQEALSSLGQNSWIAPAAAVIALVGGVSVYLLREANSAALPSNRALTFALIAGLLFILPAIAVLTLLDIYTAGLWRMYLYVPIGAAIAIVSLVALATASIKSIRLRQALVLALSLLLILAGLARLFAQQWRFEQSADAKASVLRQMVEQAPSIDADAHLMLYTTMSSEELVARGIWQLQWNMLDSAVYMLYEGRGPAIAFLCVFGESCSRDDIHLQVGNRDFLSDEEDYGDVVIFQLHDDLGVELLRELPSELRERDNNRYDPERLIDASAPPPRRARFLLASVWRE